jgi:hypothetical protein
MQLQSLAQGKGNTGTNLVAIFTGNADIRVCLLREWGRKGQDQRFFTGSADVDVGVRAPS